jgi:hypothetical protein
MTPAQRTNLLNRVIASLAFPAGSTRITASHLNRYDWLRAQLPIVNVAVHAGFQRTFTGLFQLRFLPAVHRPIYFAMMQAQKGLGSHAFLPLLQAYCAAAGRQEMSFISKLIHIINPHQAVWDSRVRARLMISNPVPRTLANCNHAYSQLANEMTALLAHSRFPALQQAFNARFRGRAYTPMRILDVSIWGL